MTEKKIVIDEQKILTKELHKPARKKFQTRRTITLGINDLWQADLADMQKLSKQNSGMKYILTVIDTFSKVGYGEPIKTKGMSDVTEAFAKILKKAKASPKNLQTDQGLEFFNKLFKALCDKNGINHYYTYSDKKAAICERFNRTIKEKIWRHFTEKNTLNWTSVLDKILKEYNERKHRTIGMRPIDVSASNEDLVRERLATSKTSIKKPKFEVGNYVRVSRVKNIFEKGYVGNWSEEIFQIKKIKNTVPTTYLLEDLQGEEIKGSFYEKELQKTKLKDYFRIDKVIRKKGNQILVAWKGYPEKFNSWIDVDSTVKL